jgi:cell pole-organizing protein PopZ
MNPADQGPEPSMEELLASIRLIISDDDKNAPSEGERGHQSRGPAPRRPQEASLNTLPEDDVLDLTDEFVFPDAQGSHPARVSETQTPAPDSEGSSEEPTFAQQDHYAANSASARAGNTLPPAADPNAGKRPEVSRPSRPEIAQRTPSAASRPVWSRRELPNSGGSPQPSNAKLRQDRPAQKQASKTWADDIQMPVPDQGPISLISTGEMDSRPQNRATETGRTSQMTPPGSFDPGVSGNGLYGTEESAVAALAEKLARSTVGALQSSELQHARDVDFQHLDDNRRSEVTEKFANAIQRESAMRDNGPLPTLLDEVFRQEFIREQAPLREHELEATDRPASAQTRHREETTAPEPKAFSDQVKLAPSEPASAAQVNKESAARQQPAESSMADQSLAQAQFVGTASSHSSSQSGRTLEDAVREMLRPLLVQWLNDNMPRIMETAIREEIATRGLLPNSTE